MGGSLKEEKKSDEDQFSELRDEVTRLDEKMDGLITAVMDHLVKHNNYIKTVEERIEKLGA